MWQVIKLLRFDGAITYSTSGGDTVTKPRQTERAAFMDANGKDPLIPPPHYEGRYDYTVGKTCSHCKRYRKFEYFGTKRIRGVVYMQSWCRFCCAEWAAEQRRQSVLNLLG
jgi:hypothetical protein